MLRVKRFSSTKEFTSYQLLQRKRWWGWQTIDREEVPTHVSIGLATVGDRGGWVSKFAALGAFGADGVLTEHTVETLYAENSALRAENERLRDLALKTERIGIEAVKSAYFEGLTHDKAERETWKSWLASEAAKSLRELSDLKKAA